MNSHATSPVRKAGFRMEPQGFHAPSKVYMFWTGTKRDWLETRIAHFGSSIRTSYQFQPNRFRTFPISGQHKGEKSVRIRRNTFLQELIENHPFWTTVWLIY